MLSNAPPGEVPEVGEHESGCLEAAVSAADSSPHTLVAEPDDVGGAVTGDVNQEAWMLLGPVQSAPAHGRPYRRQPISVVRPERRFRLADLIVGAAANQGVLGIGPVDGERGRLVEARRRAPEWLDRRRK
jgi:hypothetical protein